MINKAAKIGWGWVKEGLLKSENLKLSKFAEEYLVKAMPLAKPKAAFIKKRILNLGPDALELEGGVSLSTRYIASHFKGAEAAYLFVVTIGDRIEETASRQMGEGDYLGGYLLDRIGSLAVESLAKSAEEALRRKYGSRGYSTSARFSPGYCDWPIEEQFKLAKILDFSRAGVRLTKSCMMVPRKSISAMVAIGPKNLFAKIKTQCSVCDKKDCDHRRV